jgi:hypothetical protein
VSADVVEVILVAEQGLVREVVTEIDEANSRLVSNLGDVGSGLGEGWVICGQGCVRGGLRHNDEAEFSASTG